MRKVWIGLSRLDDWEEDNFREIQRCLENHEDADVRCE